MSLAGKYLLGLLVIFPVIAIMIALAIGAVWLGVNHPGIMFILVVVTIILWFLDDTPIKVAENILKARNK